MELGGHFWTIAPRVQHSLVPPAGRPFALTVEDPRIGPVRLSGSLREPPAADELLLVVHGLGGCADSHYMLRAGIAAEAAGIACLRISLRGSDLRGEDIYHAGLTADLHALLASPELSRYRRLYALGYSVGGHLVLRAATEAAATASRLAAVAAICAPLDIALSSAAFDVPGLWLYRRYVLGNLRRIYAAVAARRPVPLPLDAALRIRRLGEWDDRVVAPRFGFAGAADYYERVSVHPLLPSLRVPALLAVAEGDPMVPAAIVRAGLDRPAPRLEVRWLRRGGHVAFPPGIDLGYAEARGLEAQAIGWLRRRGAEVG